MAYSAGSGRGPGGVLRVVALVLAALAVAGAVTIVLLPLPRPAAGGTCGPGRGSETALEAFFDPVTIGAGPEPAPSQSDPVEAARFYQWQAFVGECQSATNSRMVDALALLVVAGFFSLVAPRAVRTAWAEAPSRTPPGAPPPGWYPDPADPSRWRWWGGVQWAEAVAPGAAGTPGAPGPPEAPGPPGAGPPPPAQ